MKVPAALASPGYAGTSRVPPGREAGRNNATTPQANGTPAGQVRASAQHHSPASFTGILHGHPSWALAVQPHSITPCPSPSLVAPRLLTLPTRSLPAMRFRQRYTGRRAAAGPAMCPAQAPRSRFRQITFLHRTISRSTRRHRAFPASRRPARHSLGVRESAQGPKTLRKTLRHFAALHKMQSCYAGTPLAAQT